MKYAWILFLLVPLHAHATEWKLVGKGEMHKLFWHVYDTALYTPSGSYNPNEPYALENTYHMDFIPEELADRTIDEMKHQMQMSEAQETAWRNKLIEIWPTVKEGDVIRAEATPKKQVVFYHNRKHVGTISDPQFVAPFMDIWLGERTTEPGLRTAILGLKP